MSRQVLRGFDPAAFEAARLRLGMSRNDLIRLAQIKTVETIRRWEIGAVSPQIDVLGRAVTAMGIGAEEVIRTDPATRYISDWRHLKLLTQPQLAAASGLTTNLVQQLESGVGELTDARVRQLGSALDIPDVEVRNAYERARRRPPGTPA